MAISIDQSPLYSTFPVGQQLVWTVSESTFNTYYNFKYICEVHITYLNTITLSSTADRVAIFKTTPNNAGVGMFDLGPFLESYVTSQNEGVGGSGISSSEYKGVGYSLNTPHPIHLIDNYSRGWNVIRKMALKFNAEGATTQNGSVADLGLTKNGTAYTFFNGILQHDNVLTLGANSGEYGFNLTAADLYTTESGGGFLTNAPTTQYANINDYGTVGFLNFTPNGSLDIVQKITFTYYKTDGSNVTEDMTQGWSNGGCTNLDSTSCKFIFAGVYPANLRNHSATFQGLVTANTLEYYTFQAHSTNSGASTSSKIYTININCPNNKGYESIRLTWLNQWGAWDYYTFTQKSTKSLTTNRTTYTQMLGSWNEATYRIYGYKGGRKNFRVNTTERIVVNTDYIAEENSAWFEDLINSTEVYILNGFDANESNPYNTITNKYVEPVLITTSDYTKKTVANDKLIQYTFSMERNKTKNTQSV